MANVSSSNGIEKYPKLRFPEFTEPWTETQLTNLFKKNTKKNNDGSVTNVISNSAKNGLIPQKDYFDKDIANADNTAGYYIIRKNDFVYNPRKSTDAPYGPISRYTYSDDGIVSPLYLCFRGNDNINPYYFEKYFKSSAWHRYIYMSGDRGARHDRVSIKDETFFEMPINLPCEYEQDKIATFLSVLEHKIEKQAALVDNLKKYKRGLQFLVFEKNQNNNWDKKTLLEIASFCGGGTPSKDIKDYWSGEIGWISSSDLDEEWIDSLSITRHITQSAIDNSATKLCPKGTISVVSRVGVGKVVVMPENLCTSQDFINITSIDGDTNFFAYQIAYKMKIQATKTQGTSIKGVTSETLKAMVLDIPSLEEQKHIATMLSTFDVRLKAEIKTLNKMQFIKNGLLQQLFI